MNAEKGLTEHLRAENSHDLDAIMETFSPDAVLVWGGRPYRGYDAIRTLHVGLGFSDEGAFTELAVVELRRHVVGRIVVVEQELKGRHTGSWQGLAPTGRQVSVPVCTVYEFDEQGRILSERPYLDRLAMWAQLADNSMPTSGGSAG
jgi:ketosteroid isomerase-like protein